MRFLRHNRSSGVLMLGEPFPESMTPLLEEIADRWETLRREMAAVPADAAAPFGRLTLAEVAARADAAEARQTAAGKIVAVSEDDDWVKLRTQMRVFDAATVADLEDDDWPKRMAVCDSLRAASRRADG